MSIAYQVVGDGPVDILYVPGFVSHLDLTWVDPLSATFFRRIASFSRLILHDKRGTGLSDPVVGVPTLEQRMDDMSAVLDAVGSSTAVLFGISEGGPACLLFAATYPDRVERLVLYGTFADGCPDREFADGLPAKRITQLRDLIANHWGDGHTLDVFGPTMAARGERELEQRGTFERAAASPSLAAAVIQAVVETDVTAVLATVRVPTLVLHRVGDIIPIESGRVMAAGVPGAEFVELDGGDHIPWFGDSGRILDAIERFVTGAKHTREPDRALATVMFSDIVRSTETATVLGDERWRRVLDDHNRVVRAQLRAFGGREIKQTGDGFLATFDGPARAIRCACSIRDEVKRELNLELRAGVHTGECEIVGDDVAGIAVHIGARVAAAAEPGEVLVSSTVRDLVVGSDIAFEDRGTHVLKGTPGKWNLLAVVDDAPGSRVGKKTVAPRLGRQERTLLTVARRAPWLMRRSVARQRRG